MNYTLRENLKIERPVVFLCGPHFSGDKTDRRKILQGYLHKEYGQSVLPLIIDDFLIEENLSPGTNVQLLEELFAAISAKTYIFLDTMSTAAELGLFANNSFNHNIKVFLPKRSDILDKSNVGYFVEKIVLGHNKKRIDCDYYRPKITRHPIASDYVRERYGFINDKGSTLLMNLELVSK